MSNRVEIFIDAITPMEHEKKQCTAFHRAWEQRFRARREDSIADEQMACVNEQLAANEEYPATAWSPSNRIRPGRE